MKREKFQPWLISHLHTAGQSLCKVCVTGLSVSERYRNCNRMTDQCRGGGLRSSLTIGQALKKEHAGSLRPLVVRCTLGRWESHTENDEKGQFINVEPIYSNWIHEMKWGETEPEWMARTNLFICMLTWWSNMTRPAFFFLFLFLPFTVVHSC